MNMFKSIAVLIVMCAALSVFNVQAQSMAVELSITTAAVGATNTIESTTVGDWYNLETLKVEFPAASTNTLALYFVAKKNGTTTWQVGDTMTYANATALPVTVAYNPRKKVEFVTAGGATNLLLCTYCVSGTPKYVLTRTGTASQTIKAVLFLKK